MKRENPVPEYKKESVKDLSEMIKSKKTILIASIKNIPSSQFHEIKKKLRGKAIIKVPKKNLIFMAIDSSGNDAIKKLKENIKEDIAVLFSDLESFELAGELMENTSPAKAKPGQESPEDIQIDAGPTDLVPGPAITELGALGIQIQIEKGKIHIKEAKVIAKKGAKISQGAADLMGKLEIKPFQVGFIPLCAFDAKENKLYLNIKIDKEGTLSKLKEAYSRALPFAVEIGYASKDTIRFLLGKANAYANRINRVITGEPEPIVTATVEEVLKEEIKHEEKAPVAEGLGALFG